MLTRKEARKMCTLIFQCPCGDDKGTLRWNAVKVGCNRGVCGWNWDLYQFPYNETYSTGIITGYRSFPADCIPMTFQQIQELRACDNPASLQALVKKMVSDYWRQKAIEKLEKNYEKD